MSDLISRSEAIKALEQLIERNPHVDARSRSQHNSEISACIKRINTLPEVDAKPVVHGKWLFNGFVGEWLCSNCKSQIALSDDRNAHPNFCPNCGADMRGEKND